MTSPQSYLPDTHCTPLPLLWGDSNSQIEQTFSIQQQQQQQQQKFYSLPPLTVGHGSPPSSPDSLSSASCPLSTTHSSISSFSDLSTTPPLSRSATFYSGKNNDVSALWASSSAYGQQRPKFHSMSSQTTPGTPINECFIDGHYLPNMSSSLPPNGMAQPPAHRHSMSAIFTVQQQQQNHHHHHHHQQQQQQQQLPMSTFNDYHFNEIKHHDFVDDSFNGWNNEQQQHFMNSFPPTPPLTGLNEMPLRDSYHHGHHHQNLYEDNAHVATTSLSRRHSHKPTSNNTMAGNVHRKSEAGLSRSASSRKPSKLVVNTELYKTELCATFIKSGGNCPYGSKCQFAHGSQDLKIVDRPPKWRSKPCQNWIKTGSCAYNERCCFRHDTN